MTLEFRDHQVLVILPGSQTTQVQLGLRESLLPAAHEIETRVYVDEAGQLSMQPRPGFTPVRPLQGGRVVDERAFFYFLRKVYDALTPLDGLPPALFIAISLEFSRRGLERLTQYVFEEIKAPALALTYLGVCTAFAFLTPESLVIDIGADKTEISAVLQFDVNRYASCTVPVGGDSINAQLRALLPNLTAEQIEDLKRSPIYEVLGAEQAKSTALDEEDGVVDIAAIVASGNTREILDKREKAKTGELAEAANASLPTNTFVDRSGATVEVGGERFEGSQSLISGIVDAVADVLHELSPREQERVFENVIITGRGALPQGLASQLGKELESRYVVKALTPQGVIAATEENDAVSQAPTQFTLAKLPEHFPEWKNRNWRDYTFLGAQICAKQILTTGIEGLFVSRPDYNEIGPTCIGDLLT